MAIPTIEGTTTEGTAPRIKTEAIKEGMNRLSEIADRLSPDVVRSYVSRGSLPSEMLTRIGGADRPSANRTLFSDKAPSLQEAGPTIGDVAKEGTVQAVTRFLADLPAAGNKKALYDGARVIVTLETLTGRIEHLQPGDASSPNVQVNGNGSLSLSVVVRYDKKNNTHRLTLENSTKSGLHRLSDQVVSPALRRGLGELHGRPIEAPVSIPTAEPSPLAAGAVSLGGFIFLSPEIMKAGALATAALALGRFFFSGISAKPSFFRRLLHPFRKEMAVKDWAEKADQLEKGGKHEDAEAAYQKAIELDSARPPSAKGSFDYFGNPAYLRLRYGGLLKKLGKYEKAIQQFEAVSDRLGAYDAAVEWAHGAVKRGDPMTAGQAYEKAAGLAPNPHDPGFNQAQVRFRGLARAWQYYVEAGAPAEPITRVIKSALSYGLDPWAVRKLSIGLDAQAESKLQALISESVAPELHRRWREDFAAKNGPEARRWKPAKDLFWETAKIKELSLAPGREAGNVRMTAEGKVEIDIAHMEYGDLTAAWQAENKAAAQDAAEALSQLFKTTTDRSSIFEAIRDAKDELSKDRPLAPEFARENPARSAVMEAGRLIHRRWLERNGSWAPEHQKAPFDSLTSKDQKLDLNLLETAWDHFQKISLGDEA